MNIEEQLQQRSGNQCELSGSTENLIVYQVPFAPNTDASGSILITEKCLNQIEKKEELESKYWERFLPTSMWSEIPAVQVVVWRILNRLRSESWAFDALDMMYIEDENRLWAEKTGDHLQETSELHKDCNGNILINGDTVTLIKDLDVKGSSINAKIGTAVRNIKLVHDNPQQIEGKIEGQTIVILTKFVKKQ